MRRSATKKLLCASAWIVSFSPQIARAENATPPHREHVRFSYRAPDQCPTESDFMDLVRARDAEIIADDEAPRTLTVAIAFDEKWHASLQTEGIASGKATRAIDGDSCESVVKSIAIFTAIALREGSPDELPPAHPELAATETPVRDDTGFMPMAPPPPQKPRRYDLKSRRLSLAVKQSITFVNDGGKHLGTGLAVTYFATHWLGIDLEGDLLFNLPADDLEYDRNLPRAKIGTHVEFDALHAWGSLTGPHRGNVIDFFLKPGLGMIWTHPDGQYFDFYLPQPHDRPQFFEDFAMGMRVFFTESLAMTFDTNLESYLEPVTQAPNAGWSHPDQVAVGLSIELGLAWFPIGARGWHP